MAGRSAGVPTLDTVAAVAGVSRATVSRVINRPTEVRPELRAAVERAISHTGYVPNRAARSLVTRRTDSVALVIQEPDTRVFADPYITGIIRAVAEELSETDIQLVLIMVRSQADHERLRRYVRGGHVDGVLLTSTHGDDLLRDSAVPLVLGAKPLHARENSVFVDADNVGGARAAVRYLREAGRQRIATIAGPQDMAAGIDRLTGYHQELDATATPLVAQGDFGRESGEAAMRQLLTWAPDLDAVFAASDLMAAGAITTLRAVGRRVPEDVAVVGFDDLETARYTDPPLSTVHQPIVEHGHLMIRLLLQLISGQQAESVLLPTHLVIRDST